MRDIKFRAWDRLDKKMFDVFMFNENYVYINSKDARWREDIELMQYTGLKDVAGIEIYEGDILEKDGHWGIRIEFYKGLKVLDLDNVRYNNKILNTNVYDFDFTRWKVIGNIYENPELLKNNG